MMRRWHHGHSLATGAGITLAMVTYRVWLLIAVAFLAGILAAILVPRVWRLVGHFADAATAVMRGMRAKREPIRSHPVGVPSPPAPYDWAGDLPLDY